MFIGKLVLISSDEGQIETEELLSCSSWYCKPNIDWMRSHSRGYFTDMGCSCDQFCKIMGDCCMDYNSTSDSDAVVHKIEPYVGCVNDSTVTNDDGFLAVVSCPSGWLGSETNDACMSKNISDLMLRLPVTGNTSGLLYRNLYCAVCHDEPYQFWRPKAECNSQTSLNINPESTIEEILVNPECQLKFLPPTKEDKYRPCKLEVIRRCAPDFNNTVKVSACETSVYMQLVYSFSGWTYFNMECAQCNHQPPFCFIIEKAEAVQSLGLYSFSVLLDLNDNSGSAKVGYRHITMERDLNLTHACSRFQIYDPFIRECRRVLRDIRLRPGLISSTESMFNDCTRLQLNESEFVIAGDGTLETLSGYVYSRKEYYHDGEYTYVCTNFSESTRFFDKNIVLTFSPTSAIITTICLFVSLVGLLITMVIYAVVKTLRNIPGKILLSLTTSLFFANLAVLFAPRAESLPTLCKVIAALMHYLFLDAFLWMNVMAADVWFTFSKSFVKAGDGGKSSKRFIFYNVYVRGVAIVLVTAAVTVDNVVSDSQFKPNYGRGLCWITNKRGLLVFFASPLFLLICLNLGFFFIAAKNIHDVKRKSAIYLDKGDRSQFGIYVKLSVVMGLTWVLGFLASLFPYTVMWCIYIIFNTLQGIFICVAFVFTRRVLYLVRDHYINP
ncbi:G-protein coupled receptor Mth-like [Haliotis rufescens]|uniref:G-protein coupled receptor Mth-like n=1 Tax=Haliotis rufescens TaxID=6454 RepID=UPI00201F75C6|nr:G-protein coupled receptor Mth-like [Haliotis rufescens]